MGLAGNVGTPMVSWLRKSAMVEDAPAEDCAVRLYQQLTPAGAAALRRDIGESMNQRRPRLQDERHLAFVRKQPCCACGRIGPSEAAHIRMGSEDFGKRSTGMQEKPSDQWVVPLCGPVLGEAQGCHREQHAMNEAAFWQRARVNPFVVAQELWSRSGGAGRPEPPRRQRKIKPRDRTKPKQKIPSRPFPKRVKI